MELTSKIAALQDYREYEELNWIGTFEDYLKVVRENPKVTRTAFQRVYDMILSYGQEASSDPPKLYTAVFGAAALGLVMAALVALIDRQMMRHHPPEAAG